MLIIFSIPFLVSLGIQYHANPLFYVYSAALLIAFATISVNIGIGIAILLSGIFYLKKLKKLMLSAGVLAVVGIITLLRMFKPERFVNPELFANLKIFLSELKAPTFILFPNRWYSESLFNFLNKNYVDMFIFTTLLVLTSYITVILLLSIYTKYHYRGWSLLQSGDVSARKKKGAIRITSFLRLNIFKKPLQRLLSLFDTQAVALFRKDFLYQFHDIKYIQQNFILLALIIVYLFSIASLPLDWEEYGVQLKYMISFLNLGLILIIIASLCSKLVYPAIVSEGYSLWVIKTAPLSSRKYISIKVLFLFIPIFLLCQLLTVFSSIFVHVGRDVFILNIITTLFVCFSLVCMAISFSIVDLRSAMKSSADEEIKTGNTIYMILSVLFVLIILVLEAIPIYLYFLKESIRVEFTRGAWLIIGSLLFVIIVVNVLATAFSLHYSIKRFDTIQLE
jgi:ABC-2 type transport system permease protein